MAPRHPSAQSLALLLFLLPSIAAAQRPIASDTGEVALRGRVVDGASGQPVFGAYVGLEQLGWGTFTDSAGRFTLPGLVPGTGTLEVERLGYVPLALTAVYESDEPPLEIRLRPQPVVLEGLRIVGDRFETRRKATATSVRAFDEARLANSLAFDAVDFLRTRAGVAVVGCRLDPLEDCVLRRGASVRPSVYIDERPAFGGLWELAQYRPHDLYLLEVYSNGAHIRAYTRHFMEYAARVRLMPIPLF